MTKKELAVLFFSVVGMMVTVIILVAFCYVLSGFFIEGNFYFTAETVLRELRADHPQVSKILKTERHVFTDSKIIVLEGEKKKEYCLDTNVFFNYKFRECRGSEVIPWPLIP